MSVRCQVLCVALMSMLLGAFGYGFKGVEGAWALASDPATPCVVLTNKTVWVREADVWRPSAWTSPEETGVRFAGIGAVSNVQEVVFAPEDWKLEALVKEGAAIQEGDVVIDRRGGGGNPKTGAEIEGRMLLKVRPDRLAIFLDKKWRADHSASKKPYRIERWLPLEGGLRFDYREQYARYDDPVNCMFSGLWLDPEDRLICYDSDEIMTFACRYDPVKDTMTMIMPPDEDEGEDEPKETVLPFISDEVRIDEMVKRIEAAKQSPEWKMRLEQLRNRPPETPEAQAARLARAQEKRAQAKPTRRRHSTSRMQWSTRNGLELRMTTMSSSSGFGRIRSCCGTMGRL